MRHGRCPTSLAAVASSVMTTFRLRCEYVLCYTLWHASCRLNCSTRPACGDPRKACLASRANVKWCCPRKYNHDVPDRCFAMLRSKLQRTTSPPPRLALAAWSSQPSRPWASSRVILLSAQMSLSVVQTAACCFASSACVRHGAIEC